MQNFSVQLSILRLRKGREEEIFGILFVNKDSSSLVNFTVFKGLIEALQCDPKLSSQRRNLRFRGDGNLTENHYS